MGLKFPRVLGGTGRMRKGKGFSEKELRKAGMWNFKELLRYDKRRKSCHEVNVELLRRIKGILADMHPRGPSDLSLGLLLQEDGETNTLLRTIKDLFQKMEPKRGIILTAWARTDGVLLILKELEQLNGNLTTFVGVDFGKTSKEAVELLQKFSNTVYIVKNLGQTFHPKVYFFEFDNDIYLSVGSHNLTKGGLTTNIEAREQILQSEVESSRDLTEEIENLCGTISQKSYEVGVDVDINTLIERGDLRTEEELSQKKQKKIKKTKSRSDKAQKPWSKSIPYSRPFVPPGGRGLSDVAGAKTLWAQVGYIQGEAKNQMDLPTRCGPFFMPPNVPFNRDTDRELTFEFEGHSHTDRKVKYHQNDMTRIYLPTESQGRKLRDITDLPKYYVIFERLGKDKFKLSLVPPSEESEKVRPLRECSEILDQTGSMKVDGRPYGWL